MKKRIGLAVTLGERGGAQVFLFGFAQWLKQQGHEPILLAGDGDWLRAQAATHGIEYRQIQALGREISPLRDLQALRELTRLFKELKLDAVHLNSSKMGSLGALAARWAHVPRSVYCIAGWAFLEPMSTSKQRFYTWVEKVTARWKDVIICLHPGDIATAKQEGIVPKEFAMIPNGVDVALIQSSLFTRQIAREKIAELCHTNLEETTPFIGTIANFFPAKDLVRYMETCALVHRAMPAVRFVILGDGMLRKEIEAERARLGLEEVVFLPGAVDRASSYLSGFDVYCLPSSKEGMSLSVLEAMAAGVATVVTDVGANRWMLDGHGWIVAPRDIAAMGGTLLEALTDIEQRNKKAQGALQHVQVTFDLEETHRRHLALID